MLHSRPPEAVDIGNGFAYGGDYNPEQWGREIWAEDIRLMREAGVNLVRVGVFSWGLLEQRPGTYTWGWLDEVLDLLHAGGVGVVLGTSTAAPPNWLLREHPEFLPVNADGSRQTTGGRLGWCPSNLEFRGHAVRIAGALAERYARHPALRMWNVANELGGGNNPCYCEVSAEAFRAWLERRYGTVDAVNEAWGTAFWGHTFRSFAEIDPPRSRPDANPGLHLDYRRFSSDALLTHFLAEKDAVGAHSGAPVTTNFMVNPGGQTVNYAEWAEHVAIAGNDHYTTVDDPRRQQGLAIAADRTRGLSAARRPWLLLETSTGGPSWQERNRAKTEGELVRNALAHVARGSDSAMFFQWRASTSGAEQFHSAMVPHAGTRTRVWREVTALGRMLGCLHEVRGSAVERTRVAVIVDDESAWAFEYGLKPHRGLRYGRELRVWHSAFWNRAVTVDVVPRTRRLDDYDVVIVPTLFVADDDCAARIGRVARRGGTVLVTYLSGIVDETARVRTGGYPGAFRDLLGVWTEEFNPLQSGESVLLDDGGTVTDWVEATHLEEAGAVIRFTDGPTAGRAAVTRRAVGAEGAAWYVAAMLPETSVQSIVDRIIAEAGIAPTAAVPPGVEAVRRVGEGATWLFLINHTAYPVTVGVSGTDLLDGSRHTGRTVVEGGRVRVIREEAS